MFFKERRERFDQGQSFLKIDQSDSIIVDILKIEKIQILNCIPNPA